MSTDWPEQFLTLAVQYYVAGRSAALVRLIPVAGNLLHHAVEMMLKGVLSVHYTPDQLRRHLHRLPELWDKFKERHDTGQLSEYDQLITALHAFENIRYPDKIIRNGAAMSVGFGGTARANPSGVLAAKEPAYALDVCEIDRLIATIFRTTPFNPTFFTGKLTADARRILGEGNEWFK